MVLIGLPHKRDSLTQTIRQKKKEKKRKEKQRGSQVLAGNLGSWKKGLPQQKQVLWLVYIPSTGGCTKGTENRNNFWNLNVWEQKENEGVKKWS